MGAVNKIKQVLWRLASFLLDHSGSVHWKGLHELNYWKHRKGVEGNLSNNHYKYFYTTHFDLDDSFYHNKVILDIGCGPRGSLEWASMALRRIGLDPLAKKYLKLGADQHKMEYIQSSSENIPMIDAECDVVCSFNSLDHVHNVDQTLKEIKRVTRSGGFFLLLVDVNHPPNVCEPHNLSPKTIIQLLKPEFICEIFEVYKPISEGMYNSIIANEKFINPEVSSENGFLSARFRRTSSSPQVSGWVALREVPFQSR